MRKILLFLLFSISISAQKDSISVTNSKLSVVSLDGLNVVYRGIPNPISVAVANAKSYKITGDGVMQTTKGKFAIKPKLANETKVVVEIEKQDSTFVTEEHIFRVKPLPTLALLVNKKGCINGDCTIDVPAKELLNAELSVKLIDFVLDYTITIQQFRLYLTNTNGDTLASYDIKGNKIPEDVYEDILNNDKASLIIIHKIVFASDLNLATTKTPMIKIKKV